MWENVYGGAADTAKSKLRFGYFVLFVVQFLAGFDDDAVIDFAFEILQAIIFFIVEKIGYVGVQTDDDILAAFDLTLMTLDSP
jgi:hypothetical protein